MSGYLIAEEGPLVGLVLRFEEGAEWVIGRDPDEVQFVLEDPMVSRKHVICRLTSEGFIFENLSAVNPATQNGKIVSEPVLLKEGDILQIGHTFFRFSEKNPDEEKPASPLFLEESRELSSLSLSTPQQEASWLLKVVTGPNAGAEFYMQKGKSYVIGKDPESCDIVFQDLSVSKQHAKMSVNEDNIVSIEDLGSRNGTVVKGHPITERTPLRSQDHVALGTTTFMVVDTAEAQGTIIAQAPVGAGVMGVSAAEEAQQAPKDWREVMVPRKHLFLVGAIGAIVLILLVAGVSLFQTKPMEAPPKHETEFVSEIVTKYPAVQFSYNGGSGKLFLTGHVLSPVEKQELMYQLGGLDFLTNVEDTVVVDEYVSENLNALLVTNPQWQGISIQSVSPGKFAVRGYVQTVMEAQALSDYLNMNFPYLDRLENQVVIESNLQTQLESLLMEGGFNNVTYQLADGEIVFSGRVDGKDSSRFDDLIREIKGLPGVKVLKNFVVYTNEDSSLVDLSQNQKYRVMGFAKKDGASQFVVINGEILRVGDLLDGMRITAIAPSMVLLEKDGLKFKINYNLQ